MDMHILTEIFGSRSRKRQGLEGIELQSRLDNNKKFVSQRAVNECIKLSADCVGASTVNIFKNKIDIYLGKAGYT